MKPRLRINSEDFMGGDDIGSANQKTAPPLPPSNDIILEQYDPNEIPDHDQDYDETTTTKLLEEIALFASPDDTSTV